MTVHHIKLKDLNEQFIQQLNAGNQDAEQPVTIWLPKKTGGISERESWGIIGMLDWEKENSTAILEPAVARLSQFSEAKIAAFEDWLSEKLYRLDGQKYAEHTGSNAFKGNDQAFSVDGFLYARCMATARGRETYEQILAEPEKMVKDETFEPLLSLASRAYKRKTGEDFDHLPAFIYETFANAEGWGGSEWLEKVLS